MSEKLPRVTANEIIKIVEKLGFRFSRQSGSHKIYKNDEGKRVTIAYHFGKSNTANKRYQSSCTRAGMPSEFYSGVVD